jgi:hypothetical protein
VYVFMGNINHLDKEYYYEQIIKWELS